MPDVKVDVDATEVDSSIFDDSTVEAPVLAEAAKIEVPNVPEKPRGYLSYDEWKASGKDPDEYKGRKAYEKEGERYEALMRTQREVKELKDLTNKLMENNQKIEEASYKRAREELKSQALKATTIGDVETVSKITDQMMELEQYRPVQQPISQPDLVPNPSPAPVIQNFLSEHPYYMHPQSTEDFAKKGFIEYQDKAITDEHKARGVVLTLDQHMAILNQRVKNEFYAPKRQESAVFAENTGASEAGHSPNEARQLVNSLIPEQQKLLKMTMKIREDLKKPMNTKEIKDFVRRAALIGGVKK